MRKENIYQLVATGLGLGYIKSQSRLWSSFAALLTALIFKQISEYHIFFVVILFAAIILGYISVVGLTKKHITTNIVIDEIIGVWIALSFISNGLLINLFAFSSYLLLSFLKPWLYKLDSKTPLGVKKISSSIFIGFVANMVVHGILYLFYFLK